MVRRRSTERSSGRRFRREVDRQDLSSLSKIRASSSLEDFRGAAHEVAPEVDLAGSAVDHAAVIEEAAEAVLEAVTEVAAEAAQEAAPVAVLEDQEEVPLVEGPAVVHAEAPVVGPVAGLVVAQEVALAVADADLIN